MITIYKIDSNRFYTGVSIEQEVTEKIEGIVSTPISYNSETECLQWKGNRWIIRPLTDKIAIELENEKEIKVGDVITNYENKLVEGFVDSGYTDHVLSGDIESFQNLQKLTDRLSLKSQLNTLAGHTQMFTDKNGSVQSLSGQACLEMLDRYSDWYEQLYFANKVKQSQIEACSTIQDLDNLDLTF